MTDKREDRNRMMNEPSFESPDGGTRPEPTHEPPRKGGRKPILAPEGVDRQFWPMWRAHVLAGLGMITGYSLGLPMLSGEREQDH